MSVTTGEVALALAGRSSCGGGPGTGVRRCTDTTRSCSTMTVPSVPVISTRRGRPGKTDGAAGKFERGDGRVFHFDGVYRRARRGVDALDVSQEPQEEVDRMNPLIGERPSAVQGPGP